MANFVATKIKAMDSAKAVQTVFYDTRVLLPKYIIGDPHIIMHEFESVYTKELNIKLDRKKKTIEEMEIETHEEKKERKILDYLREYARALIMTSVKEQQALYKEKTGQKPQLKGNWVIGGIITFSPEGIKNNSPEELMTLGRQAVIDITDELGVRPLYMSLSLDTQTPHLHYQTENIDRETGRTVARKINKEKLRKLQDIVGNAFSSIGLQRGESKDITGARYKTVIEENKKTILGQEEAILIKKENIRDLNMIINELKRELEEIKIQMKERLL